MVVFRLQKLQDIAHVRHERFVADDSVARYEKDVLPLAPIPVIPLRFGIVRVEQAPLIRRKGGLELLRADAFHRTGGKIDQIDQPLRIAMPVAGGGRKHTIRIIRSNDSRIRTGPAVYGRCPKSGDQAKHSF